MGMPNWTCADGSIGGPVCARMKDERCGWIVNDCTRTTRVDTRLTPPRKETVSPAPANPRHCTQLPGLAELRKWRIETICGPGSSFPAEPPGGYRTTVPDVIVDLKDGTFIAEVESLGCVRLRVETCHRKCLPGETLIATPRGAIPIAKLEVGALVWTLDRNGQRILGSVSKVHREAVGREHRMMAMALSDDRRVKASAGHPDFRGRVIEKRGSNPINDWTYQAELEK